MSVTLTTMPVTADLTEVESGTLYQASIHRTKQGRVISGLIFISSTNTNTNQIRWSIHNRDHPFSTELHLRDTNNHLNTWTITSIHPMQMTTSSASSATPKTKPSRQSKPTTVNG
jgi:hypothetical protein